ncbi:MAG: O-antigen ligase family protein [candidate division SR1 bacterium]|nr:O-antigen ligase family protein [candidate division SR1 bacterium]
MTILLAILGFSIFGIASYLLWHFAKFEWLNKVTKLLVLSLPFERIPSISLGGSNIRISQIIVIFGIWIFAILFLKKDIKLLKTNLNRFNYFFFGFLLFSIPSWFISTDIKRFLVTEAATLLVLCGFFLISQFTTNLKEKIKDLINVMILVTLFGYYQFIGDLIGIPYWATGLRETYTKIVFGIPRIHSTAIEPLYFAGMLFLCLFVSISYFFLNKQLIWERLLLFLRLQNISNYLINGLLFVYFLLAFLLTISKSAIVIFILMLPFFALFLIKIFQINFTNIIKKSWIGAFAIIIIFLGIYSFSPAVQNIWKGVYENFAATVYGESASSNDRSLFLQAFYDIIPNNQVIGIGSGQFGVNAGNYIPFQSGGDNFLIVNNVYLEIWLEHGVVSLLIFIGFLAFLLLVFMKKIITNLDSDPELSCINISLFFALLGYCFQWLTFSPIFIMPIFIIAGLIASSISASKI